jgi:exopolyphosphatase / guanosine-5'-triphosphate,3'-diphosphate pyrophosphatase
VIGHTTCEDRRVNRAQGASAPPGVAGENSKKSAVRVGALDVGTHAAKLLVMEVRFTPGELALRPLARVGIVTRLGAGRADPTDPIPAAAAARAGEAIRELRAQARALAVERWVAAGTGVLRRAVNGDEVARRLAGIWGGPLPVLRAEWEAALAVLGARAGVRRNPPLVVVDLGGGTTEVITLAPPHLELRSLGLGCLDLAERFFRGEAPVGEARAGLEEALGREIPAAFARSLEGGQATWLGVGGTVTALATLDCDLPKHDPDRVHGHRLTCEAVDRLAQDLAARGSVLGLRGGGDRQAATVLLAGALLLRHLLWRHRVSSLVTSTWGLRHGLLLHHCFEGTIGSEPTPEAVAGWSLPRIRGVAHRAGRGDGGKSR